MTSSGSLEWWVFFIITSTAQKPNSSIRSTVSGALS